MTDAELDDIRAAWRWAKPDHSVSRLLACVDELRANRPITPEQIAAVKRVIDECEVKGYDDFRDDPHTFGHLTSMRAVLATLEGMAAPGAARREAIALFFDGLEGAFTDASCVLIDMYIKDCEEEIDKADREYRSSDGIFWARSPPSNARSRSESGSIPAWSRATK